MNEFTRKLATFDELGRALGAKWTVGMLQQAMIQEPRATRGCHGPHNGWVASLLLVAALVSSACLGPSRDTQTVEPMRASEMLEAADPARRASTRLVIQGLDADSRFDHTRARGSYERAIQVDPTNPMAYLALARHEIDASEGQRALQLLDQAAGLFEAEGLRVERVGVLLIGLRGRAYEELGEDGSELLDRAAALSPQVWGDGDLSPEELR